MIPRIILCANRSYLAPLSTLIASIILNASQRNRLRFLIAHTDFSETDSLALREWIESLGADCSLIQIDRRWIDQLPLTGPFPPEIYLRYFALESLPKEESIALYLDSDMIVMDDIVKLMNLSLNGAWLGAVENPYFSRHADLGIPANAPYFNSGVLLVDLKKWRELRLMERLLEQIERVDPQKLLMPDQDVLNMVFYGNWKPLPVRWNLQRKFWYPIQYKSMYADCEVREARRKPGIIHFTGISKPWKLPYYLSFRFGLRYLSLARRTPWGMENVRWKSLFSIILELLSFPARVIARFRRHVNETN